MELIEQSINKVFNSHNITIPFKIEPVSANHYQSYAAYNKEKGMIFFRIDNLAREFKRIKRLGIDFRLKKFLEILVFHEVGHANDQKISFYHNEKKRLLDEMKKIQNVNELDRYIEELGKVIIESEINAWNYVEKHLILDHQYELYKNNCINGYISYLSNLHQQLIKHIA